VTRVVNRRIRLFLAALVLAFGLLFLRAAWLQGVRAQSLSRLAQTQHREQVAIPAGRGTIYDRTGVQLALGEQAITVYANPLQITNVRAAADAASRALGIDESSLIAKLSDRSHGFVYVQRQADASRAKQLQRQKIPGFGFYPEERRSYPLGSVAAQVLGYVGIDGTGLSGLELANNGELAGRAGQETVVTDPGGRTIATRRSVAPRTRAATDVISSSTSR